MNLIKHKRPDINKIYLYVKDPFESKNQLLINGREKAVSEMLKNLKAFIHYLQIIDAVNENVKDYNPTKKKRVVIVFGDMTADMESNKNLNPKVTDLFLRGRKLKITILFQGA